MDHPALLRSGSLVFAILSTALVSFSCTGSDTFAEGEEEEPRPRETECQPALSDSVSLTPDPYAANGSFIPRTSAFQAQFRRSVSGATPRNFSVRGLQSGAQFRGQSYSGNGTTLITTPPAALVPGEEVEVVLTDALLCPGGLAARLRVASAPADSFSAQSVFAPGTQPTGVVAGDLDNDGRLDLAVSNSSNTVSVLLGNGDGTFRAPTMFAAGQQVQDVALGDINRDGFLDIVTANIIGTISVLLGNGDGSFRASRNFLAADAAIALAVADLNRDGILDVTAAIEESVSVLLGTGNANLLGNARVFSSGGSNSVSVAIGDLNRDGALDIAAANSAGNVGVRLGNGDGTFQSPRTVAVAEPFQVAIGDLNNDAIPDLAVANGTRNTVTVLLGLGDGSFQTARTETVGRDPESLAIADVNGDGRLDLVVPNAESDNLSVLLGNGDGTFQPRATIALRRGPTAVTLADFNNDGLLDAAIANFESADVSVLLGRQ